MAVAFNVATLHDRASVAMPSCRSGMTRRTSLEHNKGKGMHTAMIGRVTKAMLVAAGRV
jgi:hypothetical protein